MDARATYCNLGCGGVCLQPKSKGKVAVLRNSNNRRIVIVRDGERVNHRFQDVWFDKCFDSQGNYVRQNLNQPKSLPNRAGWPHSFVADPPLTAVGCLQATLRGQGLGACPILSDNFEVFVSPALSCVKTASNVLKGMNRRNKLLRIEPGLFEWNTIQWYLNGNMPQWMKPEELVAVGFNVDTTYAPQVFRQDMNVLEPLEMYYWRSTKLIMHMLEITNHRDLLLVAHRYSFEALSRLILGYSPRDNGTMLAAIRNVPYCGMMILEEDALTRRWRILPTPDELQLTHLSAHNFDAYKTFCPSEM